MTDDELTKKRRNHIRSNVFLPAMSPAASSRSERAVPARTIDRIREGVTPRELREDGSKSVWDALVSTASSFEQRGQRPWQWKAAVTAPASQLGYQVRVYRGRRLSNAEFEKKLDKAWEAAVAWKKPPPVSADDILDHLDRAAAMIEHLEVDQVERAILAVILYTARERGTLRPAIARRFIAETVGHNEGQIRRGIERLVKRGILRIDFRGRASAHSTRRLAACYYVVDHDPVPKPATQASGSKSTSASRLVGHDHPADRQDSRANILRPDFGRRPR